MVKVTPTDRSPTFVGSQSRVVIVCRDVSNRYISICFLVVNCRSRLRRNQIKAKSKKQFTTKKQNKSNLPLKSRGFAASKIVITNHATTLRGSWLQHACKLQRRGRGQSEVLPCALRTRHGGRRKPALRGSWLQHASHLQCLGGEQG